MEKNVERLMKKTKKELVELILRKDEEAKSVGNSLSNSEKEKENLSKSLNDFVKRCDDLELRLKHAIEDCEGSKREVERLRNQPSADKTLVEENNRLRKYLQEANQNVLEHQESIDSLTTDKEAIKDELYIASKKNKRLSNWCGILYIIIIVLAILLLVF